MGAKEGAGVGDRVGLGVGDLVGALVGLCDSSAQHVRKTPVTDTHNEHLTCFQENRCLIMAQSQTHTTSA